MFSFRTSFCCCGCPLEGGTLALLITNLISYLYLLYHCFGDNGQGFVITSIIFILFAIEVAGLYGVNKKKPEFIIPHMVTQVMSLILNGIIIFALLFARSFIVDIIKAASNRSHIDPPADFSFFDSFFFFSIFVLVLLFGLQYHFFLVVLSCFFKIKEENGFGASAANVHPMRTSSSNYP